MYVLMSMFVDVRLFETFISVNYIHIYFLPITRNWLRKLNSYDL